VDRTACAEPQCLYKGAHLPSKAHIAHSLAETHTLSSLLEQQIKPSHLHAIKHRPVSTADY